jgi:hypothetical protein
MPPLPTTVSAPWTDNCGVGGAKSGNIDGSRNSTNEYRWLFSIRDYTLMQQMIVEMQLIKTVRITRQYDMTKPIITQPHYSLVGCNIVGNKPSVHLGPTTVVLEELNLEI